MNMPEEEQDFFIADYVLAEFDENIDTFTHSNDVNMVAALQKFFGGRRKYKVAFQVLSGLQSSNPPNSAPPIPEVV